MEQEILFHIMLPLFLTAILKKHIQISNIFEYIKNFFETSEKSNIIYDLYSFWAKFLAIVDLPTSVAPSSMTA